MGRKAIWLLGPLFVIAALSSIFPVAEAQEGVPTGEVGVKVGDWANFRMAPLIYESNIPGYEEPPVVLKVLGSIEWIVGEVIGVSENNVTIQSCGYYKDGTKQFENRTGDPITGSGNLSDALAPAGLSQGDQFYVWVEEWGSYENGTYFPGPITVTIDETTSRTYAGESREVNHVTLSLPYPEGGSYNFEWYFDKETGICCEGIVRYSVGGPPGYYMRFTWSWVIIETNMWGPAGIPEPQFPASAVIPESQSVTENNPTAVDAVETANTMVIISNISDSCVIKIESVTEAPPPPSGLQTVGNYILIDTSKMVTTIAVLRISYDPAELSAKGIVESSLTIHYWDGSAWVPVESHVNVEERYVWAEIDHFSLFALMGKTAPLAEEGVPVWIIVPIICVVVATLVLLYFRWYKGG